MVIYQVATVAYLHIRDSLLIRAMAMRICHLGRETVSVEAKRRINSQAKYNVYQIQCLSYATQLLPPNLQVK